MINFDNLKQKISSLNLKHLGSNFQAFGPVLNAAKNAFSNSVNSAQAFLSSFITAYDDMPDYLFDSQINVIDHVADKISTAGSDTFDSLAELISTTGEQIVDQVSGDVSYGMTLVTSNQQSVVLKYEEEASEILVQEGDGTWSTFMETIQDDEGIHTEFLSLLPSKVSDNESSYVSILDYLDDCSENAELSGVLSDACEALLGGLDGVEVKLSTLKDTLNVKYSSTKDLLGQVYSGFCRGGVYGVVQVIIDYIRGPASATIGMDGLLEFSNASSLMPTAYASGMLSLLANGLQAVASGIAMSLGPIFGGLVSLVTGLATSLTSALTYASNVEEHAKVIDDISAVSNLAPHICMRGRGRISISDYETFTEAYPSYSLGSLLAVQVCGGIVLLSISQKDDELFVSYEVHPDAVDRRAWFSKMQFSNSEAASISWSNALTTRISQVTWNVFKTAYNRERYPVYDSEDATEPSEYLEAPFVDVQWTNDYGNDVMSTTNGRELGAVIACNILIFFFSMYVSDVTVRERQPVVLTWLWVMANVPTSIGSGFDGAITYKTKNVSTGQTYESSSLGVSISDLFPNDPGSQFLKSIFAIMAYVGYHNVSHTTRTSVYGDIWVLIGEVASKIATLDESLSDSYGRVRFNSNFQFYLNSGALTPNIVFPVKPLLNEFCTHSYPIDGQCLIPDADSFTDVSGQLVWMVKPPKYKLGTVLGTVIAGAIVATAIATVTVVASLTARKAIRQRRATLAARAEKLWDNCKNDPSIANINAYRKVARKNNRFVSIFGGTKVSTTGFWGSVDQGDSLLTKVGNVLPEQADAMRSQNFNELSLSDIIYLIKGYPESED